METWSTERVNVNEASEAHWLRQLERREEMLVGKHVPRGIAEMLCSDRFNPKHHYSDAVAKWIGGRSRFLLLSGPSYQGKSVAAASVFLGHTFSYDWFVAGQAPQANRSWAYGKFVSCPTYQGWSKANFGDQRSRDLLSEARSSHLLVFDDLGTELSDIRALFTDLVSYRTAGYTPDSKMYPSSPLRTIITTNLGLSEMHELYGDRVVNRLKSEGDIVLPERQ